MVNQQLVETGGRLISSREYYESNKGKWKEYWKTNYNKDIRRRMVWDSKRRAKKYNLVHTITKDNIVIPDICPVFKIPFEYSTKYAASLDRKDNSKGYTEDNIQVISKLANKMKNNATQEELILFADWIKRSTYY